MSYFKTIWPVNVVLFQLDKIIIFLNYAVKYQGRIAQAITNQ